MQVTIGLEVSNDLEDANVLEGFNGRKLPMAWKVPMVGSYQLLGRSNGLEGSHGRKLPMAWMVPMISKVPMV